MKEFSMQDIEDLYDVNKHDGQSYRLLKLGWQSLKTLVKHEKHQTEKGLRVDSDTYVLASNVMTDLLRNGVTLKEIAEAILEFEKSE